MSKPNGKHRRARARRRLRWGIVAALLALALAAYAGGGPEMLGLSSGHGRSFHHRGGETMPVMDLLLITQTRARHAYLAAAQHRDVLDQVWCYCGCDGPTLYHKSLLSCFTSYHGANCDICQDEAIMATRLKAEGKSMEAVQDAIDHRYS